LSELDMKKLWWSKEREEWYVQVTADHERAIVKADWWEGTEIVVSQGYDYSNKYGWFQYIAVPAKQYLKHHPDDVYILNAIIKRLNDKRRKK